MTYPDKEERRILEAWNEFERGLEPPELAEGVRERLLARRRRRPARYALAIAAAALALAVGALAAAGSFEWLLGSADPRFGEVVEPVGRSSTVEGVRLELIAAQRFGDMCAVYVSLTDTELAGRVTDAPVYSSFKINRRGLSSGECELIYYDAESQCAVYEFVFSNFSDEALESVSVELTNMPTGGLVTLPDAVLELRPDEVVTGVSELVDGEGLPIAPLGRLEEIPDASGWWIAGAGVGGDGFTVILRQPMSPSNNYVYAPGELMLGDTLIYNDGRGSLVNLCLLTEDGRKIRPRIGKNILVDADGEPCYFFDEALAGQYTVLSFKADADELAGALLCCERSYVETLSAPLLVEAEPDGGGMLNFTADIKAADGSLFRGAAIAVSPMGVEISCSEIIPNPENPSAPRIEDVSVETAAGDVRFESAASDYASGSFSAFYYSGEAIDIASVRAVVIDGERFELAENQSNVQPAVSEQAAAGRQTA